MVVPVAVVVGRVQQVHTHHHSPLLWPLCRKWKGLFCTKFFWIKLVWNYSFSWARNEQTSSRKTWSCGTNWCFLFAINMSLYIICKREIIEVIQGYMMQEIFLTLMSKMIKSQLLTHTFLLFIKMMSIMFKTFYWNFLKSAFFDSDFFPHSTL